MKLAKLFIDEIFLTSVEVIISSNLLEKYQQQLFLDFDFTHTIIKLGLDDLFNFNNCAHQSLFFICYSYILFSMCNSIFLTLYVGDISVFSLIISYTSRYFGFTRNKIYITYIKTHNFKKLYLSNRFIPIISMQPYLQLTYVLWLLAKFGKSQRSGIRYSFIL